MKISHSQLEACRSDPVRWVSAQRENGRPTFGYTQATRLAICRYEKKGDLEEARRHLYHLCRRFKDVRRVEECEEDVELYAGWREVDSSLFASWGLRIRLPISELWTLSGEVTRIDVLIEEGGYRGVLLGEYKLGWRSELRMPLLQRGLAKLFMRDEDEFRVGVQELDASGLLTTSFAKEAIDKAAEEANELGQILTREWVRQRGAEPSR